MRLTNKKIEQIVKELQNINEKGFDDRKGPLEKIALQIGAHVPASAPNSVIHLHKTIHTVLQTEMMLNACISAEQSCKYAKRSCFWAAVAAIAAFVSAVVSCVFRMGLARP